MPVTSQSLSVKEINSSISEPILHIFVYFQRIFKEYVYQICLIGHVCLSAMSLQDVFIPLSVFYLFVMSIQDVFTPLSVFLWQNMVKLRLSCGGIYSCQFY
jgi:hypothetical protein